MNRRLLHRLFHRRKVSQTQVEDISEKFGPVIFVYMPGDVHITFNPIKDPKSKSKFQPPPINYIAAEFFYGRIPKEQVFTDLNSAYEAAKKKHPDSHFFIMELHAGKVNDTWWCKLSKDLIKVTSFNSKDTLSQGKDFPIKRGMIEMPTESEVYADRKMREAAAMQLTIQVEEKVDEKAENKEGENDFNDLNVPSNNTPKNR